MAIIVSNHGVHTGDHCNHAKGTKRSVLREYCRQGFKQVSVTEHLPSAYRYPDEMQHPQKFYPARFKKYVALWPELHHLFDHHLSLFLGFETEYYGPNPLIPLRDAIAEFHP